MAVILEFYPGLLSYDSIDQLTQARTGAYSDLHPPLMAVWWGWLDRLLPGPGGMLVAQNMLFWSAVGLLSSSFAGGWRQALLPVALLLTPAVLSPVGTIWKDVWMTSFLVWALALVQLTHRTSRHWPLALAVLALVLACSFRHNAFIAAAPLCIAISWHRFPGWAGLKVSVVGLVLLASVVVSSTFLTRALRTAPSSYPEQQILIHDLSAISLSSREELFPEEFLQTAPRCTLDNIRIAYEISNVCGLVYCPDAPCPPTQREQAVVALRVSWFDSVLRAPRPWLKHRVALFGEVLGLRQHSNYPFQDGTVPNSLGVETTPTRRLAWLLEVFRWTADWAWFRPWFFATLLFVGVIARLLMDRAVGLWAAVVLSGLGYLGGYLFLAPVADLRLSHWSIVASLITCWLTLVERSPAAALTGTLSRPSQRPE